MQQKIYQQIIKRDKFTNIKNGYDQEKVSRKILKAKVAETKEILENLKNLIFKVIFNTFKSKFKKNTEF